MFATDPLKFITSPLVRVLTEFSVAVKSGWAVGVTVKICVVQLLLSSDSATAAPISAYTSYLWVHVPAHEGTVQPQFSVSVLPDAKGPFGFRLPVDWLLRVVSQEPSLFKSILSLVDEEPAGPLPWLTTRPLNVMVLSGVALVGERESTIRSGGIMLKLAVQDLLAFMVTEPSGQSVSPDQPEKL